MTRARRLIVLVIGTALLLSACEAFDEGSGASPGSSPGSSAGAGEGPDTVALGDFSSASDGSAARIVGQVEPWSDRTVDGHQAVRVTDSREPGAFVIAWIPVSASDPPAPNTMAALPGGFTAADLVLTAADGTVIRGDAGAVVALTGTVASAAGDGYLDYVTRIESAGEPSTGSPGPDETAVPPAPTMTIGELAKAADGATVRVVGLIRTPTMVSASRYTRLHLQDATNPDRYISVYILVSPSSPPAPNTMERLPSSYTAADLLLTADDGTAIHDGDAVALSGTVGRNSGGDVSLESVYLVETATAPLPKPVAVTFRTIKKQKAGTLVRLTGKLDVGVLTSCFGTCTIYLEDPASGASVPIDVTLGTKNEKVPNTMWPLPSDYSRSDLRVVANDKRVVKGGSRVRVTGWIRVGSNGKRRIDPVIRIDYVP